MVISEEVGFEKPDSKIFDIALKKLHVNADETIYAGDSIETDVFGANNAGLVSIRLLKRKKKESPFDRTMRPRVTVRRISELLSILGTT